MIANGESSWTGKVQPGGHTPSTDSVERYPPTGIKVIVVGTGPAGLLTALECWRKGSEVVVLEQAPQFSPAGDFFTITPSGLSTIEHYPTMLAEHNRTANDAPIRFHVADSRLVSIKEPEWKLCKEGNAAGQAKTSMLNARIQLQTMMKDQCTRVGIPFLFGQKVVKYEENENQGIAITEDGGRHVADVVVAADGVATKSQDIVTGDPVHFQSTGRASARCGFPTSAIDANSLGAQLMPREGERPGFNTYMSSTGDLIMFFVPGWCGVAFSHVDAGGDSRESWSPKIDPKAIIDKYFVKEEWDVRVLDFLRQIPVPMVDWCLTWRDPQENWTSAGGRIVQVGDAAHPFLPTSGNGATQACEDAISLGECLRQAGKDNVPMGTRVHNFTRFQRVSTIQRSGFVNRKSMLDFDPKTLSKFRDPLNWGKWNWGLKPEVYARERFAEAKTALEQGTEAEFEHRNLPPGYKWEPWTMEGELHKLATGTGADLKENGYWGYE